MSDVDSGSALDVEAIFASNVDAVLAFDVVVIFWGLMLLLGSI